MSSPEKPAREREEFWSGLEDIFGGLHSEERDRVAALLAAHDAATEERVREDERRRCANRCQEVAHKHEGEVAKMRSASDEDDYCEDMDAAWNRSMGARECETALRSPSPAPAPSLPATEGEEALRTYGSHLVGCALMASRESPCTCGFERALAALRSKGGRNG